MSWCCLLDALFQRERASIRASVFKAKSGWDEGVGGGVALFTLNHALLAQLFQSGWSDTQLSVDLFVILTHPAATEANFARGFG